jgi:endonuclease G
MAPSFDAQLAFDPSDKAPEALEQIITSRDNFLDIYVLMGAVYCAHAVCMIEAPAGTARGTGFLVGPRLLLTNQHVITSKDWLAGAVARFDYRHDTRGVAGAGRTFEFDPDFYYSSPAAELDYAFVRLLEPPLAGMAPDDSLKLATPFELLLQGKHRGYLELADSFVSKGERINIIQHPYGGPMKVVLTQNRVVDDMSATRVQYFADTDEGSSGSPVFNQKWEVVALHRNGGLYTPEPPSGPVKRPPSRVNVGIPIRAILEHLKGKSDFDRKVIEGELPER